MTLNPSPETLQASTLPPQVLHPPLPLPPPETHRQTIWDVLRGAGILGIFSLHVFLFSTAYESFIFRDLDRATNWPWILAGAFSNGKFITLLAMTFGAGFAMIAAKRLSRGLSVRPHLARRTFVLLLLGMIHYSFFFFGDVLQYYALASLVALTFVLARDKVLMHIAGWSILASLLIGGLLGGLIQLAAVFDPEGFEELMADTNTGLEFAAYSAGSYADQIIFRLESWPSMLLYMLIEIPFIIGLFALGMLAWRRGWLSAPSAHPRLIRWALILSLAIGIPVNLLTSLPTSAASVVALTYPQRYLGGASLGIAFAILLAIAVERVPRAVPFRVLAAVGQRALTCYLFQSLLGSILFYRWGFGLYGKLTEPQLLGILLLVWGATISLALLLERFNTRGPAEWLWRKLAPTS